MGIVAAQRCSKSFDSDVAEENVGSGVAASRGTVAMEPSRLKALVRAGPERPRAQKSGTNKYSPSQESASPAGSGVARAVPWALTC